VHDQDRLADGAGVDRAESISMKIYPHNLFADAKEERRQGERAFTMVEIAIAIGVIGFALVAVIGILPTGMNVQKDNREDTVIGEDAPFFIDAIRNGGTNVFDNNNKNISPIQGLDFLTNYVEKIMIISNNGVNLDAMTTTTNAIFTSFGSGWEIVGLLSTPEPLNVSPSNYTITRAIVRSLNGAAVQQNGANQATSFRYQMDVEIVPFVNIAPDSIDIFSTNYAYGTPEYIIRSNRWLEVTLPTPTSTNVSSITLQSAPGALIYSCFDVRLHFSWPVIPGANGTELVGPGRQTYRTTVSSALVVGNSTPNVVLFLNGQRLWFFQPQLYANNSTLLAP
jgi:type II secretory pathway pseudopilin PulG